MLVYKLQYYMAETWAENVENMQKLEKDNVGVFVQQSAKM